MNNVIIYGVNYNNLSNFNIIIKNPEQYFDFIKIKAIIQQYDIIIYTYSKIFVLFCNPVYFAYFGLFLKCLFNRKTTN